MNNLKGIEQSLFSHKGIVQQDAEHIVFRDCTLKISIGEFSMGAVIPTIILLWKEGMIELHRTSEDKYPSSFPIGLRVIDRYDSNINYNSILY